MSIDNSKNHYWMFFLKKKIHSITDNNGSKNIANEFFLSFLQKKKTTPLCGNNGNKFSVKQFDGE